MATFGEPSTRFQRGGPGGPGRRRVHPWHQRSAPWADLTRPGFDPESAMRQWVAMVRGGHLGALLRLVAFLVADGQADADQLGDLGHVESIVRTLLSLHRSRAGTGSADPV